MIRVPSMGFILPKAMLTLPSSLAAEHLSSRGTPGLCCVAVHEKTSTDLYLDARMELYRRLTTKMSAGTGSVSASDHTLVFSWEGEKNQYRL